MNFDINKIVDQNIFNIQNDIDILESIEFDKAYNEICDAYIASEAECMKLIFMESLKREFVSEFDLFNISSEFIVFEDEGSNTNTNATTNNNTNSENQQQPQNNQVPATNNTNNNQNQLKQEEAKSFVDKVIEFLKNVFHFLTLGAFKEKKQEDAIKELVNVQLTEAESLSVSTIVETEEFKAQSNEIQTLLNNFAEVFNQLNNLAKSGEKPSAENLAAVNNKIQSSVATCNEGVKKVEEQNTKVADKKKSTKKKKQEEIEAKNSSGNNPTPIDEPTTPIDQAALDAIIEGLFKIEHRDKRKLNEQHKEILKAIDGLSKVWKNNATFDPKLKEEVKRLIANMADIKKLQLAIQKTTKNAITSIIDPAEVKKGKAKQKANGGKKKSGTK